MADLIDINAPDKWGNGPDTKPPNNGGGGGGMAPMQPGKYFCNSYYGGLEVIGYNCGFRNGNL